MIIDLILIVALLTSAVIGYKKGLVQMLISFIGTIIAAIVAYMFEGVTKSLLIKHFALDETIKNSVSIKLQNIITNSSAAENLTSSGYEIGGLPLPDVIRTSLDSFIAKKTSALVASTADTLTGYIMIIIAFAITFAIALIIIKIIAKIIDGITSLPVIKQFNGLGGMVFSVLGFIIVIDVVFVFLMSFMSIDKFSNIDAMLKASHFGKYLLIKYNPILFLFSIKS